MTIYLAGVFETRARLRPIRDKLRARGYVVTSSWLDEPDGSTSAPPPEQASSFALRDLQEIEAADLLIVDTFDVAPRGGREFEAGYAWALDREVWRVGPARSVFHHLLSAYATWGEALDELEVTP